MSYVTTILLPHMIALRYAETPPGVLKRFTVWVNDTVIGVVHEAIPAMWVGQPRWGAFYDHQAAIVRAVEKLLAEHLAAMRAAQKATSR